MGTNEAVQQILAVLTANYSILPQNEPGGEAEFMRANQILFIKPREVILDDPLPRHYSCISPLTVCIDLIIYCQQQAALSTMTMMLMRLESLRPCQ